MREDPERHGGSTCHASRTRIDQVAITSAQSSGCDRGAAQSIQPVGLGASVVWLAPPKYRSSPTTYPERFRANCSSTLGATNRVHPPKGTRYPPPRSTRPAVPHAAARPRDYRGAMVVVSDRAA